MEVTEDTIDAILHYGLRIMLAVSLLGIAFAVYAMAMGWK